MKRFVCPVCGYSVEGDVAPEKCPICGVPGTKFKVEEIGNELSWAAEHVVGIAKDVDPEIKKGLVDIEATIICEKDSHKGIIIGKGGQMLKRIGTNARHGIEDMMECKVNLKLWVKVKKDWRDSDYLLKNFGYNKKEIDI